MALLPSHKSSHSKQGEHTPPLQMGVQICTATMEINRGIEALQNAENRSTSGHSYNIVEHIAKGCFILPQGPLLNSIHYGFIYNSQNLETT